MGTYIVVLSLRQNGKYVLKILFLLKSFPRTLSATVWEGKIFVLCCTILYHLYNLKNLKNTQGGVLLVAFRLQL